MVSHKISLSLTLLASFAFLPNNFLLNSAQAQGFPCNNSTPISGIGEWSFTTAFNHNGEFGILGCGLDTARFWRWSATVPADYKVYTVGEGTTSLAISSSDSCLNAFQSLVACRLDSNVPIYLTGTAAADPFVVEISAYGRWQTSLVVEPMLCDAANYTEDGLEDNDTLQTAVVIGEGIHENLGVRMDDPDFYTVLIPAGEELIVRAEQSDPDTRVTIFDDQGQIVATELERRVVRYAPGTGVPQRATIGVDIDAPIGTENCSAYDLLVLTHPVLQSEQSFCSPALPNSTGIPTELTLFAPPFVPNPGFVLQAYADNGPPGAFGYLISGSQVQSVGFPMGNQAICVGGAVFRYNQAGSPWNSLGQFNAMGRWSSFTNEQPGFNGQGSQQIYIPSAYNIPNALPSGSGSILSGQSWGFQLWHRDGMGTSATSNGVLTNW